MLTRRRIIISKPNAALEVTELELTEEERTALSTYCSTLVWHQKKYRKIIRCLGQFLVWFVISCIGGLALSWFLTH